MLPFWTMSRPDPRAQRARGDSLKTLPLEEGARIRDQMRSELRASLRPVLVVMSGNEVGLRRHVQDSLTIGRDPEAGVVLTDSGVSWQHAMIEDHGDCWAVVDLGSTNGTVVNGKKVSNAPLAPNDKIVLGRTIVRFEVQDALEQAYDDELQRMLNIDDLSGLFQRRRFDTELAALLEGARQSDRPLALLVMDLDGIKTINDSHGHLFGAYVIGESGKVIGKTLGVRGVASRFGGDEFCAAVPNADAAAGAAIAEEIRLAIASHAYTREGIELHPGISIGVASYPDSATEQESLFQRADEALYRAKETGRNRVSL